MAEPSMFLLRPIKEIAYAMAIDGGADPLATTSRVVVLRCSVHYRGRWERRF